MEITVNKRARKCSRCGELNKEFYKYKNKVICINCMDIYMDLKVTCSICGKKVLRKHEFLQEDNKYDKKIFCSEKCFSDLKQEELDLEELDSWLKSYHKLDKLNSRIYIQIQDYKRKYKYTTKGILLTLKYMTSIQDIELQIDNISLVIYYYDRAKKDYMENLNRENKVKTFKDDGFKMINKGKTIEFKINDNKSRLNKILITDIILDDGGNF